MAVDLAYIGPRAIPETGGGTIVVQQSPDEDPLEFGVAHRVRVCRLTDVDTYEVVAECWGGVPGAAADDGSGNATSSLMPGPDDRAKSIFSRRLQAYWPRLAPGTYYLQVEAWDAGTSAWVLLGRCQEAVRAFPRLRVQEVYDARRWWPSPPFRTGIRQIEFEPMTQP